MNGRVSDKTPQTGAHPRGELDQNVYQAAQQKQRQQHIHTDPKTRLPGVARLGNPVAHDGFQFLAAEQFFQHGRMLPNWGRP